MKTMRKISRHLSPAWAGEGTGRIQPDGAGLQFHPRGEHRGRRDPPQKRCEGGWPASRRLPPRIHLAPSRTVGKRAKSLLFAGACRPRDGAGRGTQIGLEANLLLDAECGSCSTKVIPVVTSAYGATCSRTRTTSASKQASGTSGVSCWILRARILSSHIPPLSERDMVIRPSCARLVAMPDCGKIAKRIRPPSSTRMSPALSSGAWGHPVGVDGGQAQCLRLCQQVLTIEITCPSRRYRFRGMLARRRVDVLCLAHVQLRFVTPA